MFNIIVKLLLIFFIDKYRNNQISLDNILIKYEDIISLFLFANINFIDMIMIK